MVNFTEMKEQHCTGYISISGETFNPKDLLNGDLGIAISNDGRLWICINGKSFLRFKPRVKPDGGKATTDL